MVFIKKMICMGFKSFRKRTVINFDKGFTAIIGANGSGKSNIIDAFVFVLGELSAKTLRANNIKDLISNGGKDISPSETASVEIIFDNRDRGLPIDSDEVSILRKIDRKGNGLYKLNGKRSTRKEIMNLLDLSGVAPNSSNMIMQGDIFRLIKMTSNERRELIEDIAGIASYNDKKSSAEKELAKVEENLGQISILLNEVRGQLEQLEMEKNDAEHYLELINQRKIINNALYSVRINTFREKIRKMEGEKAHLSSKIHELEKNNIVLKEEIESLNQELEKINEKIKTIEDSELLHLTSRLKENKEILTSITTEIRFARENIRRFEEEFANLEKRLKEREILERTLKEELASIQEEQKSMESVIELKTQTLHEVEMAILENDRQFVEWKNKAEDLRAKIQNKNNLVSDLKVKLRINKNRLNDLMRQRKVIEERILKYKREREQVQQDILLLEKERRQKLGITTQNGSSSNSLEKKLKEIEEKIFTLQNMKKKLKPQITQIHAELIELQSRVRLVKQLTGNSKAVSALKKIARTGDFPGILYGTISELGSVDEKFSIAMEMAAGNRFNYIVVDSSETAQWCIQYLKEHRLGRASFIPLDKIRYSPLNVSLPSHPKIYGKAVDLIEFDPLFRPAFEFIFGRTIIVEDITTARFLNLSVRKVTLDGDIIESSNLMTGGQKLKPRRIGFQSNESKRILELEQLYANKEQELKEIERTLSDLQNEMNRVYRLKLSGNRLVRDLDEKIAMKKAKITSLTERIEEQEEELRKINEQISMIEEEQKIPLEEIEGLEQEKYELQKKLKEIEEKLKDSQETKLKKKLRSIEKEIQTLNQRLTELKIRKTKVETKLNETLKDAKDQIRSRMDELNTLKKDTQEKIEQLLHEKKNKESEKEFLEARIREKDSILSELLTKKKTLLFGISEKKTQIAQNENQIHPIKMKINTYTIKMEDYSLKIKEWECQIIPDIKIPEDLLRHSEDDLLKKEAQIEQEITSLGAVNLRAIDQYNKIKQRYKELEAKNENVIEEREAILEFIETLEKEKLRAFMNTFEAINRNFGYIFAKLSPNGEAKLKLENPEDPFEGGVEIMARPGNKKWCLTQAMSGGEKTLTIIALILGIQMHIPSPYYILDEIDAALDDANAALVADMIKELSSKSQFIIITHRDVTMARTDHLLGVSNRGGISSVINLSIRDVLNTLKETENSNNRNAVGTIA